MEFNKTSIVALARICAPMFVTLLAGVGVVVDVDVVYVVLLLCAAIPMIGRCGWKNNSMTSAAQEADEFMQIIKAQGAPRATMEDIERAFGR